MCAIIDSWGIKPGYALFLSHTASDNAKSNFLYIQHVGHHFFDRGSLYRDRKDYKSIHLLYTLGGKGYLSYRGRNYEITEGQVMVINCFDHQIMRSDAEKGWHYKWMHFHGVNAEGYFNMIYEKLGPVIDFTDDTCITQSIDKLIELVKTGDMNAEIRSSEIITGILTHVFLNGATESCDYRNTMDSRIKSVLDFIESSYSSNIKNSDLTKAACYSKCHLYRVFKAVTGYHPHEYLVKYRINKAKRLLKTSDMTVEEISQAVGFESTSNLISTFRKLEGMTPLKYRKAQVY